MAVNQAALGVFSKYQDRMYGHLVQLGYFYSQICIKHDVTALLPVTVKVDGEDKKIEEVAKMMYGEGEENDDKMFVYPNMNVFLSPVMQGIRETHPEFRQDIIEQETPKTDDQQKSSQEEPEFGSKDFDKVDDSSDSGSDEPKYYYLMLTMPPVDKDRRKQYLDMVKTLFDITKTKIDVEKDKLSAEIAPKVLGATKEEVDDLKKGVENLYNDTKEKVEMLRQEKEKEIEEGYDRYLANHPDEQDSRGESSEKKEEAKTAPTQEAESGDKTDPTAAAQEQVANAKDAATSQVSAVQDQAAGVAGQASDAASGAADKIGAIGKSLKL